MGYDIHVTAADRSLEMNWLRNPFGLCPFAEDNVGDGSMSLWHVCNDNAYDTSNDLDRPRFLDVVTAYREKLQALELGYFHFEFSSYVQFASSYRAMILPWGVRADEPRGYRWDKEHKILGIDVERFIDEPNFGWSRQTSSVLQWYKDWFDQLFEIAKLMQEPGSDVYISN